MSRPPRTSDQVHRLGLLVNLGLAAIKLVSGGLSGSRAVFADGVHSLADVVTAAVVWLGYRWSRRPPDEDHHYGHENGESLAAVLVGGLVVATGVGLVVAGVTGAGAASPDLFGVLALSAEGLTVAVKLWLAKVTRRAGEAAGSPSLTALSHDNRADAWTSALVYAGPQGVRGLAAGRFDPDPHAETVAVFGYSGLVQLLRRTPQGWTVESIFDYGDKGHWLGVAIIMGAIIGWWGV